MFVTMRFLMVLAFIMTFKSYSALKISRASIKTVNKANYIFKAQAVAVQVALSVALVFGNPAISSATPLGEHSGCSYPACTSQEEILKASAPGLIPQYEKDEQVQLLKDVEFTLKEFPALVEAKDYASIRGGFRSYPGNSLRLTARKVKNFIDPAQLILYNKAYATFIDDVDYVDLMASQRLQKRGSDEALSKAVTNVNLTYKEFMKTLILSVPPTVAAVPAQ